ncbi:hypothetical protein PUN28_009286 [Cardiocondyla obscurior]|uniref:Uncharacterized protein n=1 Tax=Cardiocondyla obscurior TaxID=286306 RepID=A0AAW2FUM7_9HYME
MYVETTGITKQGTRPTSRETSPWNCGSDATTDALMRRPATPSRISLWSLLRQERGDPARVQHRKEELRMGNGSEKFGRGYNSDSTTTFKKINGIALSLVKEKSKIGKFIICFPVLQKEYILISCEMQVKTRKQTKV